LKQQVYIDGQELEVEDVDYPIEISIFDCDDLEKRRSVKSVVGTIPLSAYNKKIIGYTDDVNHILKKNGRIGKLSTGLVDIEGTWEFYDTVNRRGYVMQKFQILGGSGDWVKKIEKLMLTTLNMNIAHTYSKAAIDAAATGTLDYWYPLINYGMFLGYDPDDPYVGQEVFVEDRFPAVRIAAILEQIFNDIGYTVVSTFIASDYFQKKFMTYGRPINIYSDKDRENNLFQAGWSAIQSYSQTFDIGDDQNVLLFNGNTQNWIIAELNNDSTDPNFDNGGNYNTTTFKYTNPKELSQRFRASLYIKIGWPTFITGHDLTLTIEILEDGVSIASESEAYVWTPGEIQKTWLLEVDAGYKKVIVGKYYQVRLTISGTIDCAMNNKTLVLNIMKSDETRFWNEIIQRPARGYAWTVANILPDIKQPDFVKTLAVMFDLMFLTNVREKKVYIEPWDDFFPGTVMDWSGLVDISEAVERCKRDIPSWREYKMQIDSKDTMISNYKTLVYLNNGDGSLIEVTNGIFADTLMDRCRHIGLLTVDIPKLWNKKEPYPDIPEATHEFLPRILNFEGDTALVAETWLFEGDTKTTYPEVTVERWIDLIEYHRSRLEILNNAEEIKINVALTEAHVNGFINAITGRDFRSYIFLDAYRLKGQYIVNAILGYKGTDTTQVELVQKRASGEGVVIRELLINSPAGGTGGMEGWTLKTTGAGKECLITDPAIIIEITDETNWSAQLYIGSLDGLVECQYYIDWVTKIKYEFDGTHLVRFNINTVL
jgi:hypothetical protein